MCGQELLRNKGSRARKQVKKINFIRKAKSIVTIQVIVNGAPLSAAIIPSKTSNPFFLIVEM